MVLTRRGEPEALAQQEPPALTAQAMEQHQEGLVAMARSMDANLR